MPRTSIRFRLWGLPLIVALGFVAVLGAGYAANREVGRLVEAGAELRSDRDALTDAWFGVQDIRTTLIEAWAARDGGQGGDPSAIVKANLDYIQSALEEPMARAGREDAFRSALDGFRAFASARLEERRQGHPMAFDRMVEAMKAPSETLTTLFQAQYHEVTDRLRQSDEAIRRANGRLMVWLAVTAGAVLALLLAAMAVVIRSVVGPLAGIERAMLRLSQGDAATDIPHGGRQDEIGSMARAALGFKESLLLVERLKEEQAQADRRERQDGLQRAAERFESEGHRTLETVQAALRDVNAVAAELAGTAAETARSCAGAADGAETASRTVRAVAGEADTLAGTATETLGRVAEAARVATQAAQQVTATDANIRGLSEAADRIGQVVGLIVDIAARTRMLALNATIEAARAGEAGKGFAVVAGEVKHLADQTTRATQDITAQIGAVQSETRDAVEAIQRVSEIILTIDATVRGVAALAEAQGNAAARIKDSLATAADGSDGASRNIARVSQAVGATDRLAGKVFAAAALLSRENAGLKGAVETFLAESSRL